MINCFSHISTEEHARHYSETRSRSNVSENIDKTNFFNGKSVPVDWELVLEYFFVAGTAYQ